MQTSINSNCPKDFLEIKKRLFYIHIHFDLKHCIATREMVFKTGFTTDTQTDIFGFNYGLQTLAFSV